MANVTNLGKNSAGRWVPMGADGLAPSQMVLSNGSYSATDILALTLLAVASDTLVLSPKSGATDITLSAAEIAALGVGATLYGRWDEIQSTGAGCKVLAYIA